MARGYEYVISGPPVPSDDQDIQPQKSLSIKRDSKNNTNLRALYRNTSSPVQSSPLADVSKEHYIPSPTSTHLPPTPPAVDGDDAVAEEGPRTPRIDLSAERSSLATPVQQQSPPTPDLTPPRDALRLPLKPFLALRPSIASTRAESFRTARENIFSDDDSDSLSPDLPSIVPYHAPISGVSGENANVNASSHTTIVERTEVLGPSLPPNREQSIAPTLTDGNAEVVDAARLLDAVVSHPDPAVQRVPGNATTKVINEHKEELLPTRPEVAEAESEEVENMPSEISTNRSKSLRERLKESNNLQQTTSTERFANIIGWNEGVGQESFATDLRPQQFETNQSRWSGTSTASAVEAYVVDSPLSRPKRGTLRKVHKNDSLRAASSPISSEKKDSQQSKTDSPHRLTHKKVKLDNRHRWSDESRSLSLGSSPAWNKMDVVTVAVIPQRNSSLPTSTSSSKNQSRSTSGGSAQAQLRKPSGFRSDSNRHKRAFSESSDRNPRDRRYPPQVPARSSSLSAPTSRSGSRANSISSEAVSAQRQQAEKDLRTTLDRMESERLVTGSKDPVTLPAAGEPTPTIEVHTDGADDVVNDVSAPRSIESTRLSTEPSSKHGNGEVAVPGTKEWADLRPSTIHGTPFSHISIMSRSPEIVEATAVNLFPHNNHSVQLIEPNRLPESQAVRELRKQHPFHFGTLKPSLDTTTPRTSHSGQAQEIIDSPLRNPRKPPNPPRVNFIPSTPNNELDEKVPGASSDTTFVNQRGGSLRLRPSLNSQGRSESFMKSLARSFSARKATNPKANQDLDSKLYPFWRPRAFWDDEDQEKARQERNPSTAQIGDRDAEQNKALSRSLSYPNGGSVGLIRRLSERHRYLGAQSRERQRELNRQNSFSSLQRIRASRKLYKMPGRSLSLNMAGFRLNGLRDWQERLWTARAKKEDEKREKRRQALRQSIGVGVISQGDSRFPANGMNDSGVGADLDTQREAVAASLAEKRGLRL